MMKDLLMNDCKYCKKENSDGIEHVICLNEEIKVINNSEEKDIPCMGVKCGKYIKNDEEDKQ